MLPSRIRNAVAQDAAVDLHAKHDCRENDQNDDFGNEKTHPAQHDAGQKVRLLHWRGKKSLKQLSNSHVHSDEPDAPQPAAHDAHPEQAGNQEIDIAAAGLLEFAVLVKEKVSLRPAARCSASSVSFRARTLSLRAGS